MFTMLKNLFGARPAKAAKAVARQARPRVESLDDRLLLSATVPNLVGDTLAIGGQAYWQSGRALAITYEQDNGNGTGTIVGRLTDSYGSATVSGTIAFDALKTTYRSGGNFGWGGTPLKYDFQMSFGGWGFSNFGGYEYVTGGGDFQCYSLSGDATTYGPISRSPSWSYSGWDTEYFSTSGNLNQYYSVGHTDTAAQAQLLW